VCHQALFVLGLVNSSQSLQVRSKLGLQHQHQQAGLVFDSSAV
jgi:hypothetical protein